MYRALAGATARGALAAAASLASIKASMDASLSVSSTCNALPMVSVYDLPNTLPDNAIHFHDKGRQYGPWGHAVVHVPHYLHVHGVRVGQWADRLAYRLPALRRGLRGIRTVLLLPPTPVGAACGSGRGVRRVPLRAVRVRLRLAISYRRR